MPERHIPPYEVEENLRPWPRCYDCGRPYPMLSMDLKCVSCEERARMGIIVWLAAAIVLISVVAAWWIF